MPQKLNHAEQVLRLAQELVELAADKPLTEVEFQLKLSELDHALATLGAVEKLNTLTVDLNRTFPERD